MPINVIGWTSTNTENKTDRPSFVQKPYLKNKYIESDVEEKSDMKIKFRIKNLLHPVSIRKAASRLYVDNEFNNPSKI